MQRRRGAGVKPLKAAGGERNDSISSSLAAGRASASEATNPKTSRDAAGDRTSPRQQLRRPRHGGWKGAEPGREARFLHGEPGYHLGIFRVAYGVLLVQRTLAFMSSGAVDASFRRGDGAPARPGAGGPKAVLNFAHGFIGTLGSTPSADVVRSACWCLCAAGAALSVGFRPNAVAFGSAVLQLYMLLLEKSLYTDEAYLFALIALLLAFTDCGKTLGLDAPGHDSADGNRFSSGGGAAGKAPLRDQPPDTIPHWHVVLVRFQICILHVHRGLARAFTSGWLLDGQPLLGKLRALPPTHLVRRVAQWATSSGIPGLGGAGLQAIAVRINGVIVVFDLILGLSLLAAPTYRPAAVALQSLLHLSQAISGPADARPWHLLIAASGVLFMDSSALQEKLDRLQGWLQPAASFDNGGSSSSRRTGRGGGARRGRGRGRGGGGGGGGGGTRGQGGSASSTAGWTGGGDIPTGDGHTPAGAEVGVVAGPPAKKRHLQPGPNPATAALIFGYVLAQVLVPLRHLANTFPVEWSREGLEFSWRAGGGGLVDEEALVRILHRSREGGGGKGALGVQTVHLYGSQLTAQQVLRMVVDPDMLLQLAKASAESLTTSTTTESTKKTNRDKSSKGSGSSSGGGFSKGELRVVTRTPPYSHVDAWKSVNGRPFSPWIDPRVDIWNVRFEGKGPSPDDWLHLPPSEEELERAAGTMEMIRDRWAARNQSVTFFAARPGQALTNVFLGAYDPGNFNTTDLCSVPQPPPSYSNTDPGKQTQKNEGSSSSSSSSSMAEEGGGITRVGEKGGGRGEKADAPVADGGGILIGVAAGEVELLTDPGDGRGEPKKQKLTGRCGVTVLAPMGEGHSILAAKAAPAPGVVGLAMQEEGLAIWYYVHACPDGLFHLCIGYLSGAGWQELYKPSAGTRKGWVMHMACRERKQFSVGYGFRFHGQEFDGIRFATFY